MADPQILDCTLRDGGYRNGWRFGESAVAGVLDALSGAGLAYVECGFLADGTPNQPGRTVFGRAGALRGLLPQGAATRFVAMAIWGQCRLDALPPAAQTGLFGLRLSFDRHEAEAALAGAHALRDKGYAVFLQPVRLTTNYTPAQLNALLRDANRLAPHAFYLVDSLGVLAPRAAVALHRRVCGALAPGIAVGFHGHNHRQLALANALALAGAAASAAQADARPLILDSCLGGMGKAAGNVPTEVLAHSLGLGRPSFEHILAALDALGPALLAAYPVAYFLASAAGCNTAYADWLAGHGVSTMAGLYAALEGLPPESRAFFDEKTAERLL